MFIVQCDVRLSHMTGPPQFVQNAPPAPPYFIHDAFAASFRPIWCTHPWVYTLLAHRLLELSLYVDNMALSITADRPRDSIMSGIVIVSGHACGNVFGEVQINNIKKSPQIAGLRLQMCLLDIFLAGKL